VHPGEGQLAWDIGFLLSGLALSAIGWALIRGARFRDSTRAAQHAAR
jgi:hypothetical protein